MTDLDLHEGMADLAAEAPAPPVDLLGRIEKGRRRHRRNQGVTATFAAVAVLAAGSWAVLRPPPDQHQTPVAPPVPPPVTFRIPDASAKPALITSTWPGALVGPQEPEDTPDGSRVQIVGRYDTTHLLMKDDQGTFHVYDAAAGTFRQLSTGGSRARSGFGAAARSADWLVFIVGDAYPKTSFSVYKTPITGGARQLVGTVDGAPMGVFGIYATDEAVYWGDITEYADGSNPPRVTRMSLTDGSTAPVAGSEQYYLNGSAWARTPQREPTTFRNLVTGETRAVTASPGRAECVPAFCLVQADKKWFVQRLDGSLRTELPWSGPYDLLGMSGETGLILLPDHSLLDPLTGKRGIAEPGGGKGCLVRYGSLGDQAYFRWATPGDGCSKRKLIYIGADD